MKIFYYCFGSAHSSVVAASIHLGMLPSDRIPSPKEFANLPHYDKTNQYEIGTPFMMGRDEFDSEVFILGMTNERKLVKKAILSFFSICGISTDDIMMIDTLKNVNFKTRIGGYLSRRLGCITLGRPLTIKGIQERYTDFVDLVEKVKEREEENLK
ncbi:MAG: DUF3189 family protein [Thermoanaerobacterales bacterium]|jgi:hypothetical protein|nr:DUF3189 family protein [Thermoanaerobacterales bacterium]